MRLLEQTVRRLAIPFPEPAEEMARLAETRRVCRLFRAVLQSAGQSLRLIKPTLDNELLPSSLRPHFQLPDGMMLTLCAKLRPAVRRGSLGLFPVKLLDFYHSSLRADGYLIGNAKATILPPEGRPDFPPPAEITTNCRPFAV